MPDMQKHIAGSIKELVQGAKLNELEAFMNLAFDQDPANPEGNTTVLKQIIAFKFYLTWMKDFEDLSYRLHPELLQRLVQASPTNNSGKTRIAENLAVHHLEPLDDDPMLWYFRAFPARWTQTYGIWALREPEEVMTEHAWAHFGHWVQQQPHTNRPRRQ